MIGAIEAGGTKFNCAIGTREGEILEKVRIATTDPETTLSEVVEFFQSRSKIEALGIGSFGPLDLNPQSPTYGYITATPKLKWQHTPLLPHLKEALQIAIAIDTDVNAAALGEQWWGAGQGLDHVLYLTIGTGIGGGAVIDGKPLHGFMHPEMGHLMLPRNPANPAGVCPFHGSCFEGLLSGPALAKRWSKPAEELPADHPCWAEFAELMGLALANLNYSLSPQKIILGGGVMHQPQLLSRIHEQVSRVIGNYLPHPPLDEWICTPGLGDDAGLKGSLALAVLISKSEA